jgi:hypothetical protein
MRILSFSTLFILLGIIFGWASAMQGLNSAGLQSVKNGNGWQEWQVSGHDRMLPYSLGHFLGEGQLPPPKSVRYYQRSVDDDGNTLRGDCAFLIEGKIPPARWWSIAAGRSQNASLSAGLAVLEKNNNFKAVASRLPASGNWIVPEDQSSYTLTYVLSEVASDVAVELPHVKKMGC